MNNRKKIVVVVSVLLISIIIWGYASMNNDTKVKKPKFKVVLKESIYIEYGVDLNDSNALLNVVESHVIDEVKSYIPSNAEFTFDIDNSEESFNFYERAKILRWDEEGKEVYPGYVSVGDILAFHKMVGNSVEGMKAITQKNEEFGLEEVKPHEGEFTLKIGNYYEKFDFEYYVVDFEIN